MNTVLTIEWKHIGNDVTGTCERCSLTGGAILDVLEELQPYFREKNITARFRETVLPDSKIDESNQVLINGVPMEEYLSAPVPASPATMRQSAGQSNMRGIFTKQFPPIS